MFLSAYLRAYGSFHFAKDRQAFKEREFSTGVISNEIFLGICSLKLAV